MWHTTIVSLCVAELLEIPSNGHILYSAPGQWYGLHYRGHLPRSVVHLPLPPHQNGIFSTTKTLSKMNVWQPKPNSLTPPNWPTCSLVRSHWARTQLPSHTRTQPHICAGVSRALCAPENSCSTIVNQRECGVLGTGCDRMQSTARWVIVAFSRVRHNYFPETQPVLVFAPKAAFPVNY